MKTRSLAVALLLSSLAPVAALPQREAFAQAGTDDATTKMARQRFQEGVAYYDKGQYELARASFLQAYALRKHPAVLLNLAQSSLKSGHALEAAHYFQQFLKEHTTATDAQRADANRGIAEARTKLGRIDVVGATVGTDVFIDDERIGMAPIDRSIDVEPGSHMVRAQGPNGEQTVQVTANAGVGATAKFAGMAPPVAAAPAPAAAPPPAAEPPPEAVQPPQAESKPDAANAPFPPPVEESGGGGIKAWPIVLGSAFIAAGVGTAIVMAIEKQSAQQSADSVAQTILANGGGQGTCGPNPAPYYANACAALASDDNNVNTDATIANIGIGVAAAAAVGTVIYVVVALSSKHHSPTAVTQPVFAPLTGKGMRGLMFGTTF